MVTTWNLERKLCLEVLFILFLSEIFLSNSSLNCSLSSLWFLTDLIWHSVRPSLSKHCATRWFHLGKGGYVVRNRAHLTDLLQFIFLGTLLFSETIDFDQKWAIFAQKGQSRVRRRCFEAKNQLLFEMVHEGPNGPSRFPCCVISLVFVVELTNPSHRSQLSRAIN